MQFENSTQAEEFSGKIIIVAGPSGSGKGTLVEHVRSQFDDLTYSISCTTRSSREGEIDGVDYHFMSREAFMQKVEEGDMIEWAEYGGNLYGTPKEPIIDALRDQKYMLLEIEMQGIHKLLDMLPRNAIELICISAGSWETLSRRILERADIPTYELRLREERYSRETEFCKKEANAVVHNQDGALERAKEEITRIIANVME